MLDRAKGAHSLLRAYRPLCLWRFGGYAFFGDEGGAFALSVPWWAYASLAYGRFYGHL